MNILMLSKSRYRGDVRVRREAETLAGDGHLVRVIAIEPDSFTINDVAVIGIGETAGLKPRSGPMSRSSALFRGARWALLPEHRARAVEQFQERALAAAITLTPHPEAIHAHDFPALRPAATLAESLGARLVYDAHEFWPGLPRYGRPEPLRRRRQLIEESELIGRAAEVITVSEGAADLLRSELGAERVTVVRNVFPARDDLHPPDSPKGALYAGRIGEGRDLETVFAADAWQSDLGLSLHLMGPRDESPAIPAWATLHESGTMEEVDELLAEVGIGLVTLARGPLNHEIALPNKLFQAIAVGVPVVAAHLPEIARLVADHPVGALYEPGDPESLTRALREVSVDYPRYLASVAAARPQLDWAHESRKLIELYRGLGNRG